MNNIQAILIERLPTSKKWEVCIKHAFEDMLVEIGTFKSLSSAQAAVHHMCRVPVADYRKVVTGQYLAEYHDPQSENSQVSDTWC